MEGIVNCVGRQPSARGGRPAKGGEYHFFEKSADAYDLKERGNTFHVLGANWIRFHFFFVWTVYLGWKSVCRRRNWELHMSRKVGNMPGIGSGRAGGNRVKTKRMRAWRLSAQQLPGAL